MSDRASSYEESLMILTKLGNYDIFANEFERLKFFGFININHRDTNGNTILHHASMNGNDRIVELLLDNGADESIKNNEGKTPSDLASNG